MRGEILMANAIQFTDASPETGFDNAWNELYPQLRARIRHLVYSFHVPLWSGQEDDLVEDILQETARRLIERFQKAQRGEAAPVRTLESMAITIAYNYCRDLRRRDYRLLRLPASAYPPEVPAVKPTQETINLSEVVTEHVYQETLFTQLAHEIARFPHKQRTVLLTDLANRMCFERMLTPLQKAFLKAGIRLQDYQQPLPEDAQERSRITALLHYAYRRIAQLELVRQSTTFA